MGGGSYSGTWANSVKDKYQTKGYVAGSYNMNRYAKLDKPANPKEIIMPLIQQYIKKKNEIQNSRLSKKHEEFFDIVKKLLDIFKQIDKRQAEILIEKYEQLRAEYKQIVEKNKKSKLDEINEKYIGSLNRLSNKRIPDSELKEVDNYNIDFLLSIDFFTKWLDETLKNYKLYPEEQEQNAEEKITVSKQPQSKRKTLIARIKDFFEER